MRIKIGSFRESKLVSKEWIEGEVVNKYLQFDKSGMKITQKYIQEMPNHLNQCQFYELLSRVNFLNDLDFIQ